MILAERKLSDEELDEMIADATYERACQGKKCWHQEQHTNPAVGNRIHWDLLGPIVMHLFVF